MFANSTFEQKLIMFSESLIFDVVIGVLLLQICFLKYASDIFLRIYGYER